MKVSTQVGVVIWCLYRPTTNFQVTMSRYEQKGWSETPVRANPRKHLGSNGGDVTPSSSLSPFRGFAS